MSFLPGSHKTTQIAKRFVRLPQGGTGFEELIPNSEIPPKSEGKYILETCDPGMSYALLFLSNRKFLTTSQQNTGDLVIIHGSVLHKSERNASPYTRFAYTFHMIDSPPQAAYDEKNWLQPTKEIPFSNVLAVAA